MPKHSPRCEATSQVQPEPSMDFSQKVSATSRQRSPTRRLRAAKIPHSEMFVVFQAIEVSELILNLFCHNYIPLPRRKLDDSGAHLVGRTSNPHAPQQTRSQGPDVLHSRYRYTVLLYRRLIFVSVWVIASSALKNKHTKKVT